MDNSTEQIIKIPLSTHGARAGLYEAIVSIEDLDLANLNWSVCITKTQLHAARGKGKAILMHREIMERMLGRELQRSEYIRHLNKKRLDNRRENLQLVSNQLAVTKGCVDCKQELPLTEDYFHRAASGQYWSPNCKKCAYQRELKRREANRESHLEYHHQYYQDNRDAILEQQQQYLRDNQERIAEYQRIYSSARRARKRNLPDTFTVEQWQTCLDYFNGCCAVCGRQLNDLFGTHYAAADHFIPLSYEGADNPGTVATNIIPLCHGIDGCNNSKSNKLPDEWLIAKYGKRKAMEVLQKVETYFEWVRSQHE
jgi:5-methylcytosine-specific restriction endonuclease McrA